MTTRYVGPFQVRYANAPYEVFVAVGLPETLYEAATALATQINRSNRDAQLRIVDLGDDGRVLYEFVPDAPVPVVMPEPPAETGVPLSDLFDLFDPAYYGQGAVYRGRKGTHSIATLDVNHAWNAARSLMERAGIHTPHVMGTTLVRALLTRASHGSEFWPRVAALMYAHVRTGYLIDMILTNESHPGDEFDLTLSVDETRRAYNLASTRKVK